MRVDLRRGQALVPEQLLDDAQVRAAVEEVRGERVAQRVRRDALGQPGEPAQPIDPVAQAADAERRALVVQEDRRRAPGRGSRRRATSSGRASSRYASSAAIAGRPSSPMRSLRPLPSTRISPRRRSTDESSAAASSLIRSPAA